MTSANSILPKKFDSAAYHEAAHVTAAVVQAMPLRATGIHVDLYGNGCAEYFDRAAGDFGQTERDKIERMRTVIALFAGQIAQLKFCSDCDRSGWGSDLAKIRNLLSEMYPEGSKEVEDELRAKAERSNFLEGTARSPESSQMT